MNAERAAPATAFVIFGASGDLAARKLIPALFALERAGELHDDTRVIGYARSDYDDESLRAKYAEALGDDAAGDAWERFAARLSYVRGGYDDVDAMRGLGEVLDRSGLPVRVFYTSTPPGAYEPIATALAEAGLNRHGEGGEVRLVIEKPFGTDLRSAERLNRHVLERFDEEQVYRIDHYLAKETAQNLAVLRFANTLFEPVWSNRYIDHVQITMAEPIGVEGRGSFYESAGVIRDVFQNHLLQLVALIAMEPPARWEADAVRGEKVKVFDAMACLEPGKAVLGQYARGNGMDAYREEEGVDPDSNTATYAAAEFAVHNWRWAGVPFFVRGGKRLEMKATEIVLHLKKPPHMPFAFERAAIKADRLVLRISPDEGISFRFNGKTPGQGIEFDRVSLDFSYDERFDRPNPDAYETLLLDAMIGDATLFMRADEVEAQWRVVRPLLVRSERDDAAPEFYEAGSMGPREAYAMLEAQGRHWHRPGNGRED